MTEFEHWLAEKKPKTSFTGGYCMWGKSVGELLDEEGPGAFVKTRELRGQAIARFGFAILDSETLRRLACYSPILEVGAGTGYWSWELRRAGADVIATDPHPYKTINLNGQAPHQWLPDCLLPLTAQEAIERFGKDRTLLTVWPDMAAWPYEALRQYTDLGGKRVIHVGEYMGCTADDRFFELLGKEWEEMDSMRIPQWEGVHDYVCVYGRKLADGGPADEPQTG